MFFQVQLGCHSCNLQIWTQWGISSSQASRCSLDFPFLIISENTLPWLSMGHLTLALDGWEFHSILCENSVVHLSLKFDFVLGILTDSKKSFGSQIGHGLWHWLCLQFNDFLNTIFSSSPAVALIVAVLLDNTLDYKDSARDRGMPWWVKFRTFKGDSRNEEFYTLPFNLNRFFPPS